MSMLKKLTDLANSEKGKEFAEKAAAKAKQLANDPETREKIDAAKKKITDRVSGDKPGTGGAKPDASAPTATPGGSAPTATPGGHTDDPPGTAAGAGDGGPAA